MKLDALAGPFTFEELAEMADDAGIKLEITGGIPTWETFPGVRHQKAVGRILFSVERVAGSDCGCFQIPDVYIKFPDGSLKRPDISIFREEPPDIDEAYPQIPEAVLEVLSKDFEKKDTEIGAPVLSGARRERCYSLRPAHPGSYPSATRWDQTT